jgi:hypothetical protein
MTAAHGLRLHGDTETVEPTETWYIADTPDAIPSAAPLTQEQALELCAQKLNFIDPNSRYLRTCLGAALARPEGMLRTTGNPDGLYILNMQTEEGRAKYRKLLQQAQATPAEHVDAASAVA